MKKYLFVILAVGTVALAQRPGWDFEGPLHGGYGPFQGKIVAGEPYSGTGVTTRNQVLGNSNAINESNCVKVYRDASGRTRREETPNSATCSATPATVLISDPVAGIEYVINTQKNTYKEFTIKLPPTGTTPPVRPTRPVNPNQVQTSLGTELIPGTSLTAQGAQTVTTIPAGQLGNSQPIVITSIRWYSPDLQVVIQNSHTDPRNGTTTYQLSNISTAEPADSLFQLPAGLTLQQGPSGRGRHGQ